MVRSSAKFCSRISFLMYKIFMSKLPATHCSYYELGISLERIFAALLRPVKSAKFFNREILGYTVMSLGSLVARHLLSLPHPLKHLGTRLVCTLTLRERGKGGAS